VTTRPRTYGPLLVHATVITVQGHGVLIQGPSGSGKSDLALRLLDRGAALVADDCALLTARRSRLFAEAPHNIFGMLEVRGVGIIDWPTSAHAAKLDLAVNSSLITQNKKSAELLGIKIPLISIDLLRSSSPFVVESSLKRKHKIL